MGAINGTEQFKKYLDKEIIQLGEGIDSDRVVEFEIDWLGEKEDIEFVFGGCHCTDAWYSEDEKKIRGNISIAKAGYDRNTGVVSQTVFVYLNDGNPYYQTDTKLRRISNPEKGWLRIGLAGTVKI